MKKLFKSRVKRGLPGGPNEVISDIQGMISMEGYRKDSPDKNKSVNLIPSNHISMWENDGTPLEKGPIMGIDNLGNQQMMYPGAEYIFPGDQVFEIPMLKHGGPHDPPDKKPLFVTDKNDPTLQAFQDSLSLYNQGAKDRLTWKTYGPRAGTAPYWRKIVEEELSEGYAVPNQEIQPIGRKVTRAAFPGWMTADGSAKGGGRKVYKSIQDTYAKPQQPVFFGDETNPDYIKYIQDEEDAARKQEIINKQQQLIDAGFKIGKADGIWGPKSDAAWAEFVNKQDVLNSPPVLVAVEEEPEIEIDRLPVIKPEFLETEKVSIPEELEERDEVEGIDYERKFGMWLEDKAQKEAKLKTFFKYKLPEFFNDKPSRNSQYYRTPKRLKAGFYNKPIENELEYPEGFVPKFQDEGEFKSLLGEGRKSVKSDTFKNSIDRPLDLVFPVNSDMSKRPDRFGYKERRSTVELTKDDPRYKQIRKELRPFVKDEFKNQKLAKKFPRESYFTGNKSYNPSQEFLDRVSYQAAHRGEDKMGDTDELVRIIYDDLGLKGFNVGANTGSNKQKRFAQRLQHSPEWYAANALNELGALGVTMPKNQYGGEELPKAQNGIGDLMKFQETLKKSRPSLKEKVDYNNQVTKLQNFAEQARKQEAINKAAGVENIKANIPLTPAEKTSAVVEPIIKTAKKELNPARIYEQLQKSDLGPGFQQAFDWFGDPAIKFGIKTYNDPKKVGEQLLTTASDIAALPYTLPKEYYDSGMFNQMIMNDSEAAMDKVIKRGSSEFNWSNLFDAEAAETSMQGLAAAPFISPMLRGTVKGLSAAPKVIDKAIFPKRVFRARTASGKPNIVSGEQSALEKELLDKVEKQGAWYTDDIKELGIYLKGNNSRAGIFQGDDMIIDQVKVPFWAKNKNILTNKYAMALKKEQGFLAPDEMGGLFDGRINPNEYIIPNSIFYPKTSTPIKAMPKGVAKKPLYYTRPSDGKIVNINREFSSDNMPFNDRDFAYFTKPYQYLDDQVQGATGVNPGFYQNPSTMEGLSENIALNESARGTVSGVKGMPYDLEALKEYFLMNEAQKALQYPNPAVLETYENLLARMLTPEGRRRMDALDLLPFNETSLPSILGGTRKSFTNVPPIVVDNTTYGYATSMPTFDQIALHSAMPKTYGIPKSQQVLRHELEHIIRGNRFNQENTTTIIDDMLGYLKLDGKPTPKTMEPGYYSGRAKSTKPKKLMPKEEFLGNKQNAIDYFTSGSGGNERSAFLAELQEYMMQKGVIPKQEYTKITPSMIKDVEKIYLKEKAKGEGNLRILDIIKKDDDNYKILAKGLNTMLGLSPLVAPTIMSEMDGGELPKMQAGNGERKRSSLKSRISNLTPADYPKSTAVFHSGTPLTIDQPIVGPNIFQEAMENTKKLASEYDEVKPISKPKTFEIDLSNPKTAPTTLTPLTPSFLERKDVDQIEKNRSNINSLTDENIILRSQLLKNPEEQYVIIDKKNQRLKLYQGDKVAMDFEVVMGKNPGDAQTTTKALDINKDGTITDADRVKGEFEVDWSKGNLSTGAGKYKISGSSPTSDPYYQSAPSFYLKNESGEDVGSAIHGSPDYRVPYFGNETLDDNRASNGCINGKCTDIQALYNMNLKEGTNVYILPEDDGNYFEYVDGDVVFRMSPENRSNYLEYTDEQGRKQKGQGGNYSTNTLKYKPIRSNFDEKSFRDQVFQWNDFNDEGELIKTTKPFINSLVENKQDIMKAAQINSDVYNQIARMTFGIYGAESNYGDSHSALGNFTRAAQKYFDSSNSSSPDVVSKYDTYGADEDYRSVGYTQIRWSYLNDKEKEALKKLNINSNKDLFDPKKAAAATAIILGVRYNEQLTGDQKKDIWKHLPAKWNKRSNYGTRVKNNARFLKFEQWD